MRWIAVETHTHTKHSDAQLSVERLIANSRLAELDAVVLSDHNTDSGMREVPADQCSPEVIPGVEWTTFYGHLVAVAPEKFVDWRDLDVNNLDTHLRALHDANGVAIMAHPCDPGEPFCCGCHWDFKIEDWNEIDAVEVWHEEYPYRSKWNASAKELWLGALRSGFHLTALSASDWHVTFGPEVPFGVNYLQVDETLPTATAVKEAIRKGQAYFTLGPTVQLAVQCESACAQIGDRISAGNVELSLCFNNTSRRAVWEPYNLRPQSIALLQAEKEITLPFPGYGQALTHRLQLEAGFFYVELRGTVQNEPAMLLMTNPIYIY